MSLKEMVHALGADICEGGRFGGYCDFAPAEETLGFADTSAERDGTRGIAFMCDALRVRTEKKVLSRDYSDITATEIIPSFENAFADELVIKSNRKDLRITDYSINKEKLKLLIDSVCAEYNRMSEEEREEIYRECFTEAMSFYCEDSSEDEPPEQPDAEEEHSLNSIRALALRLLAVHDDESLTRADIIDRYESILSGHISVADTSAPSETHTQDFSCAEKFPPINEAAVFTDYYGAVTPPETVVEPVEAFDEVVASEEIPLMVTPTISETADFPAEGEIAEEVEETPAPTEEYEAPAEQEEDFPAEGEIAEEVEETPAPTEEYEAPAEQEDDFPAEDEIAEEVEETPAPTEEYEHPAEQEENFPAEDEIAEEVEETPAPTEEYEAPAKQEEDFPAEDEIAENEEETPVPTEEYEAPAEQEEDFPAEGEIAEDVEETPAPTKQYEAPAEQEEDFPAEGEIAEDVEETPIVVEQITPVLSEEPFEEPPTTSEPDIYNEIMAGSMEEMTHSEALSFLKSSISEINAPAEDTPADAEEQSEQSFSEYEEEYDAEPPEIPEEEPEIPEEVPEEPPIIPEEPEEEAPRFTREPMSDDIYLIASRRLREKCEQGIITHEQIQHELKMSVKATAKNFTEIVAEEDSIPPELLQKIRTLKRASGHLKQYLVLGEDIASRVMFFMLYQMLVFTDRIENTYGSSLNLGSFTRRFTAISDMLAELNS